MAAGGIRSINGLSSNASLANADFVNPSPTKYINPYPVSPDTYANPQKLVNQASKAGLKSN